ncbi:hypothetical protein DLJ54_09585 [Corynebacterium heidelbergense]|uniref:Uncharacterized protein n=1 Tax=Corynebacterium heidelbergense TaxID=2055947 RepID=A0A364V3K9_9CORY|nr:hypothetical protein DLJ54_09585 [Corynebacterium heidelbergense]
MQNARGQQFAHYARSLAGVDAAVAEAGGQGVAFGGAPGAVQDVDDLPGAHRGGQREDAGGVGVRAELDRTSGPDEQGQAGAQPTQQGAWAGFRQLR